MRACALSRALPLKVGSDSSTSGMPPISEGVELARLAAAHDFVTSLADLLAATGHAESFADYMQKADSEVTS